jgi:hypothetical protein
MTLSLAEIQNLNRQVGWPESEIIKSSAIAKYESGGKADALNDGSRTGTTEYSVGLYQINTLVHHGYSIQQLQDPFTNSSIALQLWRSSPSYADWYNSNLKYLRDYDGIATQARNVYNGNPTTSYTSPDNTINFFDTGSDSEDNTGLYILVGFVVILILT